MSPGWYSYGVPHNMTMTATITNQVYAAAYGRIDATSFAEIRDISWETVANVYARAWHENNEPGGWTSPDEIEQELYAGVAEDIRDIMHGGLADALSAEAWTAPDYSEDCYLSSEWD